MSKLDVIKKYFRSIETGDFEGMVKCYEPSAIQIELPNLLKLTGDKRSVSDLKRDFAKGAEIIRSQAYEVQSITEQKDRVAVEVLWRGILAVPIKSLREGDEMKVHSAIFFEFKNDLILSQKNYDCFEPF